MLIHPYSIWVRGKIILGWNGPLILINGDVVVGGGGGGGGSDSVRSVGGPGSDSGGCDVVLVGSVGVGDGSAVVGGGTVDDIGGSGGTGGTGDPYVWTPYLECFPVRPLTDLVTVEHITTLGAP